MSDAASDTEFDQRALEKATAVDADGVRAVAVGTVAWAIAAVILWVFFRDRLAASDSSWWLWVCVTGCVLGLLGLPYVLRRRAVYRRHAANGDAGESQT